ncbi:MAG TPA: hypothetical protein EYP58_01290 [bacterium (Candidatus Stahlbacteria)]|nr:hypothetical protein [Candidatus Stahlbacteria bacterium]
MVYLLFFLASWEVLNVPTNENLYRVCFVDSQHGWAVGSNGTIVVTSNGGNNWTFQSSPTNYDLHDICFIDMSYGWACGWSDAAIGDGVIIATINGGNYWDYQTGVGEVGYTAGIDFINQNYGWAVGYHYIDLTTMVSRTSNSGNTWIHTELGLGSYLKGVDFLNSSTGFACGTNGLLIKSTDGGVNWSSIPTGISTTLYDIQAFDDNHIIVAGDTFLFTTDGGANWTFRDIGNLRSLSFLDFSEGWVCGDLGIFRTQDTGRTWVEETTAATPKFNSIQMIDSNHGFCAGDYGVLLRRVAPPAITESEGQRITDKNNQSFGIYDITGRRVLKTERGIYFIVDRKGVRKVVKLE